MFIHRQILVFALLLAFVGCSDGERKSSTRQVVEVSQNLPASLSNAVLNLHIREPIDSLATNHSIWGGDRSLKSPVGSGGVIDGTNASFQEERLIAIVSDGFEVLFTRRDNGVVQTNIVLFHYGEVTQTNTLDWSIVGKFK